MKKARINLYLSESALAWLERFRPCKTKSGSVGFVAEWAIQQLRKGTIQAFQLLDLDERIAILRLGPSVQADNLAGKVREWLELEGGYLLDWDAAKRDALIKKLGALTPAQTLGLICWAKGCAQKDPEAYAEDASILI